MPKVETYTCYKILGIQPPKPGEPGATQEEIKLAYRRALLANHPDKRSVSDTVIDTATPYSVDDVTGAFRTLVDSTLRDSQVKLVDCQGVTGHENGKSQTATETVDLDDLEYDSEKNTWYRDCHCGELKSFRVTENEMDENRRQGEVITSCLGCSLHLKVTFALNDYA